VVADAEAAARRAAEELVSAARDGLHIALSGGSTPRRCYELAATAEPDWSLASLWWSDERAVPPDDPRSNYLLAAEALLTRLERGPAAVRRIRGELGAGSAAAELDEALQGVELGLALLGLGSDGHTASLFPGKSIVSERERLAVATEPGLEPWVERVTMTVPALCATRRVVFLVVGTDKAEAARKAFCDPPAATTPASLVRSIAGSTVAILDEAAAQRLQRM
jgi:6-phosphogluconolactonase